MVMQHAAKGNWGVAVSVMRPDGRMGQTFTAERINARAGAPEWAEDEQGRIIYGINKRAADRIAADMQKQSDKSWGIVK